MTSNDKVSFNGSTMKIVAAVWFVAGLTILACLPPVEPGADCDPDIDIDCVCTLDSDDVTDVTDDCREGITLSGEDCTCFVDDFDEEPEPNPEPGLEPDPEPESFRFVVVEDLSSNRAGDFPGADIDALGLIKANGAEIFAQSVSAETDIDCAGNQACDANALLGAPDAIDLDEGTCFGGGDPDGTLFTALNGGAIIVEFSSAAEGDVTIENGDAIHVYEVGSTECGRFDDDSYRVSVGVTDDFDGTIVILGEGKQGDNIIEVEGL